MGYPLQLTIEPFAFSARPIDITINFLNNLLVGLPFNVYIAGLRSVLYSNAFQVISILVTSFLARAFGSIALSVMDSKV